MKSSMRISVLLGVVVAVVGVASCTTGPQIVGQVHGIAPAPDLGVMADENFQVLDMLPRGPVAAAGVQVGDVLLDLAWIPSDAPRYVPEVSDVIHVDRDGFVFDPVGNPYVDATGRRLTVDDLFAAPASPSAPIPAQFGPAEGLPAPVSPLEGGPAPEDVATPRPPVVLPITVEVLPGNPVYTPPVGPPAALDIEKETVPFTPENVSRIHGLAEYGVPLKLRVQRGDQVLELTVTPTTGASRYVTPAPGAPTPTPISSAYYF
jgi:hypothetical protein